MNEKAVEIQEIPHTVKAYVAGLIDGEGTVSLRNKTPRAKRDKTNHYNIEVYITSTNKGLLEWVVRWFGGTIYTYKRKEGANTDGYKRKPIHKWHLHGGQAENFLRAIRPYLIIKKVNADLAIEFREKMNRDTSWHKEYGERMKSLQKSDTNFSEPVHTIGQDQLQKMLAEDWDEQLLIADVLRNVHNKTEINWDAIDSHEKMWLAFAMKEKYSKTWNGKDWE